MVIIKINVLTDIHIIKMKTLEGTALWKKALKLYTDVRWCVLVHLISFEYRESYNKSVLTDTFAIKTETLEGTVLWSKSLNCTQM